MSVQFCPFILIARCKEHDFGTALQYSVCNKGRWQVIDPARGQTTYQCHLWIDRKDKCALAHIASLAQ
jgi:hypothetical protein